jgi:hypothetical protein
MDKVELPFGGIFDVARPGRGGHAWWRCDDPDLNRAAGMLLSRVDRILEQFADADQVWLATIELDLQKGRFPDLFASFFSDPTRNDETRFCVPQILKDSIESSADVGTLVCELCPGRLRGLLACEGGFRWGSALRVGGVQVPADSVKLVLKGSLFDPGHVLQAEKVATSAWAASADLNALAMWAADPDEVWRERVKLS